MIDDIDMVNIVWATALTRALMLALFGQGMSFFPYIGVVWGIRSDLSSSGTYCFIVVLDHLGI